MKFKVNVPKPSSVSRSSLQSRRQKTYETVTAESWNELRLIGSRHAYQKLTTVDHSDNRGIHEPTPDWDLYIAQFNEQYKQNIKEVEAEHSSVSTIAETREQLLESRERRMVVYRKLFMTTSILLLVLYVLLQNNWFQTYIMYPTAFLEFKEGSYVIKMFTKEVKWYIFFINSHCYFAATMAILSTTCLKEKPRFLYQYILRVPYFTLIPMTFVFMGVKFTGALSTPQLELKMNEKINTYHSGEDQDSVRNWDNLQKLLYCCGIHGLRDWDSVDRNLQDNITYVPKSCCPKKFWRDKWNKVNQRDVCHELDKAEFEWAFSEGCLKKAYEFYLTLAAGSVAFQFFDMILLCLNLYFGKQYYTLLMKRRNIKFKYHFRDWFWEILFWDKIAKISSWCGICCKRSTGKEAVPTTTIKRRTRKLGTLNKKMSNNWRLARENVIHKKAKKGEPENNNETDLNTESSTSMSTLFISTDAGNNSSGFNTDNV